MSEFSSHTKQLPIISDVHRFVHIFSSSIIFSHNSYCMARTGWASQLLVRCSIIECVETIVTRVRANWKRHMSFCVWIEVASVFFWNICNDPRGMLQNPMNTVHIKRSSSRVCESHCTLKIFCSHTRWCVDHLCQLIWSNLAKFR